MDALALAQALIAAPSISPARGPVFDVLEAALTPLGFAVSRFIDGEPPDGPVENLLATRPGDGDAPHFAFAGHLDVVPPGAGWTGDAFTPRIVGGLLRGRGATDMKAAIAAFVAAAADAPRRGRLTLVITGDEEGPATWGTRALIAHLQARNLVPDLCLVGEPTSAHRLGDTIKIGRRGSLGAEVRVAGVQGHVAYPELARNPIPPLVRILSRLLALRLDGGNTWFQPSNLELTTVDVGNPASNVIPAAASARLSIRFNDEHHGDALVAMLQAIVAEEDGATLDARVFGEAFLTPPGPLSALVGEAVTEVTGLTPSLSTTGGTSDARFLSRLCPVVEFGPPNATMHKVDEAIALADLRDLQRIYAAVLARVAALSRRAAA